MLLFDEREWRFSRHLRVWPTACASPTRPGPSILQWSSWLQVLLRIRLPDDAHPHYDFHHSYHFSLVLNPGMYGQERPTSSRPSSTVILPLGRDPFDIEFLRLQQHSVFIHDCQIWAEKPRWEKDKQISYTGTICVGDSYAAWDDFYDVLVLCDCPSHDCLVFHCGIWLLLFVFFGCFRQVLIWPTYYYMARNVRKVFDDNW